MSNYIPNEITAFDDQKPPWMNVETEHLITTKKNMFLKTFKNNQNCYYTYQHEAFQ